VRGKERGDERRRSIAKGGSPAQCEMHGRGGMVKEGWGTVIGEGGEGAQQSRRQTTHRSSGAKVSTVEKEDGGRHRQ